MLYTIVVMAAPLHARAFWIRSPGEGEIRAETLSAPKAGEVCVETLFTAISRGTESLVLNGRVPESEHERMRAPHQAGSFRFPIKYGYLNVGRVVDEGRVVFCLY